MVNPTGYTALDLIGFTDKGAYSSSANYVKNDLVHYSGNIWRCLIDDTSGIAPAEGVNWTLFIGEPTNLVEKIIAPVETDPATSAWAVGRQIIFNDNLYEVIAAITAGDALVAYEDDPTNANIKLADPVETQLLNLKDKMEAISEKYVYLGQNNITVYKDDTKTWAELLTELATALHTYCTNNIDRILNVHCVTISGMLDMQASAGRDFKYGDLPNGLNANGCSSSASAMQIYTLNASSNLSSSLLRRSNISTNSSSVTDLSASVATHNIVARCLEFQKIE